MKRRQTHKTPLSGLQRLAQRVEAYRPPSGPFDYATRAQAMNDAREFFYEIVREGKRYYADPKAESVTESARRLYYAALDAACPPGFWEEYQRLRAGDPAGLEVAVAFLEADPWFQGSGYVKVKLVRHIKQSMLTPGDVTRLQNVVLNMVERRNGQEFHDYCRLARKVASPRLREQLARRLTHDDPDIRRRTRWVLEALAQKDKMEERA